MCFIFWLPMPWWWAQNSATSLSASATRTSNNLPNACSTAPGLAWHKEGTTRYATPLALPDSPDASIQRDASAARKSYRNRASLLRHDDRRVRDETPSSLAGFCCEGGRPTLPHCARFVAADEAAAATWRRGGTGCRPSCKRPQTPGRSCRTPSSNTLR